MNDFDSSDSSSSDWQPTCTRDAIRKLRENLAVAAVLKRMKMPRSVVGSREISLIRQYCRKRVLISNDTNVPEFSLCHFLLSQQMEEKAERCVNSNTGVGDCQEEQKSKSSDTSEEYFYVAREGYVEFKQQGLFDDEVVPALMKQTQYYRQHTQDITGDADELCPNESSSDDEHRQKNNIKVTKKKTRYRRKVKFQPARKAAENNDAATTSTATETSPTQQLAVMIYDPKMFL